ncbi:MAG: outer membrane protein assembly factor BamB family protein [Planctomycetota bacterium]|jgi:outer membrane protein assembly factor BamB/tetratricopeptide (TPR) repeat protein
MRKGVWLVLLLLPTAPVRAGEGEVRLLTDDAIPRYLARGQLLARNQEWEKVVDVLHRVVIGDKEVFPDLRPEVLHSAVYSEDGQLFYPARELCLKELARLPPEGLRAYRDAYDRDARALFEEAETVAELEGRLARYAQVYDRFLPSTVGDDALERAGDLNLSLGRYYEALALFRRIIDVYPKDTDRVLPMVFAKAAYCAARIGDREHRDVLLERLASEYPNGRIRLEGKAVRAADLKDHALLRPRGGAESSPEEDWPLPGGSPARSRVAPDLPEDLPRRPLWSFRLAERDARLQALFGTWLVTMHDREPSAEPGLATTGQEYVWPYPTVRPVVHGGVVLYKDYLEIVARRLGSGTMLQLRSRFDPGDAFDDPRFLYPLSGVRPGAQGIPQEAQTFERIYRHFDYGGNTIVVGGDYVIVVEQRNPPTELRTVEPMPQRPNLLVAYSRTTGKTIWAWHGDLCAEAVRKDPATYEAWQRDYQNHATPVFQGPGVVSGGILYTLAHEKEKGDDLAAVSLWAIDVRNGRVRFRTPLHYADEMRKLVPRGAALAVAGGVVYVVTHAGVVAAVDALPPGRVRWIHRYQRNYVKSGASRRGHQRGLIQQGFAYNEPVVAGGKVIVMAADAAEIVAFDAETGRLAWKASKRALGRGVAQIAGVSGGTVLLAGDKVLALDLARGETAWGPVPLQGWPHGRGFVGRKYVYLPTKHENARRSYVERFDLADGARAPSLQFDVEKLGNLVCADGRLLAANGDEVMCFTTLAAELARIDARLARDGPRSELLLERGLVSLTGDAPRRDQARADFRRALEAAAREHADDGPIRGYALANLLAIARERKDLKALDEARALVEPLTERRVLPADFRHHPYEAQIAFLRVALLGGLGRGEEALGALERFLDLHGRERVVKDERVLDGSVAAGQLRDQLLATNTAFKTAFEKSVRGRIQAAYERRDKATLREIPGRYQNQPPSEEAFFVHARLCEEDGELVEAERVLRDFIAKFENHRRRAGAHLHLARLLARQNKLVEAQRERSAGISRLDERGRALNAKVLAELERLLRPDVRATVHPRIRIPLEARRLEIGAASPVPIEGDTARLPEGYALFAGPEGYFAVDARGEVLWKQPDPAGGGAEPGPENEPSTAVVAAAIASSRLAQSVGGDLILGDVFGLLRLDARSGEVRWRYPEQAATARTQAQQAIALVHADLRTVKKTGHLFRRHPLPGHVMSGSVIVRVHPVAGVEALHVDTGRPVWIDADIRGMPVGPPAAMGGLVAIGWSKPGRIRIYGMRDGLRINEFKVGVLFAPPVLDPLGRVVVLAAEHESGRPGRLMIVNARGQEPAHPTSYPVPTSSAAVLHADGKLVVYHDGSSGTKNLHFLDLELGKRESLAGADLLRDFQVIRDGYRLFVFTFNPGLEDEGARLFRVDLKSGELLSYDLPLQAHAWGRPVLTRRYLALAASLPRSAHVRLFDRDASVASRGPQPVFLAAGGGETAALDFRAEEKTRYPVPPAIAVSGEGLIFGHPFGTVRLRARDAR